MSYNNNEKLKTMPIELIYTDSEIIRIQKTILRKPILTAEDLATLAEINAYMRRV